MVYSTELHALMQDRWDAALAQVEQQEDLARLRVMEQASYATMKHCMSRKGLDQFIAWEEIYWILHSLELKRMYLQGLQDGLKKVQAGSNPS
jgi:hypothetical protein